MRPTLDETPSGRRIHIAFFGKRNAGKSTLVNAVAGQQVSIVSDVPGTTTDPVSKAMEILPLGPCLLTDTAGLDDIGSLGEQRVKRSLAALETADMAVLVTEHPRAEEASFAPDATEQAVLDACADRKVPVIVHMRGDEPAALLAKLAAAAPADPPRPLVADLVSPGDRVVCVCPIDSAAPKGRLILPQQQVIRELLDSGACAMVCRETELPGALAALSAPPRFVITDSQAFAAADRATPPEVPLTSFSIVFARAKGDLALYCEGAAAMARLKDGDKVLIAEGCTHRRQCKDIGTVKLPGWISAYAGRRLKFSWVSGNDFPEDLSGYALVVHCGGCMLTRRAVQARLARCRAAGVPVTNYGVAIAACHGITAKPDTCMVERGHLQKERDR